MVIFSPFPTQAIVELHHELTIYVAKKTLINYNQLNSCFCNPAVLVKTNIINNYYYVVA